MKTSSVLSTLSFNHPRAVTGTIILFTITLVVLVSLPTLWPNTFRLLHAIKVDVDVENMLPENEPVRVFHREMKADLTLHDMIVLGVVNDHHPDGVFNVDSLQRIHSLTEYAKGLRWESIERPGEYEGVIEVDLIAPSTVDNVEPGSMGEVRFEWLMPQPPKTREEALAVRKKAERLPFLQGTLLSEDGKALCLYIPITSKDLSYQLATKLSKKVEAFEGEEEYFITGLPVAEDTLGVKMFTQMGVSAPLTMLVIFLLMLYFFRKFSLIISPLIVAGVAVICTMCILVVTGHTIHVMSSLIPVFILPIAVLNSIHILSEFYDRYQEFKDRRTAILAVIETLFTPMLFTSLTTAVGFASLALAPIPPVQVFGVFVAFGVMMAWFLTLTLIPAYITFIRPESLENYGLTAGQEEGTSSPMSHILALTALVTFRYAKTVLVVTLILAGMAVYGITRINVNDNPIRWFAPRHPIRIADRELNKHFAGSYMAYLAFQPIEDMESPYNALQSMKNRMPLIVKDLQEKGIKHTRSVFSVLEDEAERQVHSSSSKKAFLTDLEKFASGKTEDAPDEVYEAWEGATLFVNAELQRDEVFKEPAILNYIAELQASLGAIRSEDGRPLVGKSNSLTDIVRTIYRELMGGDEKYYVVPPTKNAVAQTILQYESSHRPQDLWHFVVPQTKESVGFRKTSLWIQMKSGDNQDMVCVVDAVKSYLATHPAPIRLKADWFGLNYINVVWQQRMVTGMLKAFMGSFLVVLLMMMFLFRSGLWGVLSMVPLTVTIALTYGILGLFGKDYDMPVAVLSSLSLGLSVDYAIHFLARSQSMYQQHDSWVDVIIPMFSEPARAISRNAIVVGVGFLTLLPAPLVPYQTIGTLVALILLTAGASSLLILPALVTILEPLLFPKTVERKSVCKWTTRIAVSVVVVALVALNINLFTHVGTRTLVCGSIGAILVLSIIHTVFWRRGVSRIKGF